MVDSSFTKNNSKGSAWTVQDQDWRLQFSQEILRDYFHGTIWIQDCYISTYMFFRPNNWQKRYYFTWNRFKWTAFL